MMRGKHGHKEIWVCPALLGLYLEHLPQPQVRNVAERDGPGVHPAFVTRTAACGSARRTCAPLAFALCVSDPPHVFVHKNGPRFLEGKDCKHQTQSPNSNSAIAWGQKFCVLNVGLLS